MSKRNTLLTTAAAAALVGAMTTGASAFDVVDWDWTASVGTDIDVWIDIDIDDLTDQTLAAMASGIAQVESGQAHQGNLTGVASLTNVGAGTTLEVNNSSLAVANNQSISASDLALIHSGQYGMGEFSTANLPPDPQGLAAWLAALANVGEDPLEGVNGFPLLGIAMLAAAGNGYVDPAIISSTANLSTVTANDVTNSATAMTNSASWTVGGEQSVGDNTYQLAGGILVGDLTQVGIANVAASATLNTVVSVGTTPEVNNLATAVGNNLNVRVGVGDPTL